MKFKYYKYFFIIFVLFLISYAIIYIYKDEMFSKTIENIEIEKEVQEIDTLNLGVIINDNVEVIFSKNKDIMQLHRIVYGSLVTLDENYKVIPSIAIEIAQKDKTNYLIKIDDNVYWSNGSKLKIQDIKNTIELLKNHDNIYSNNVKNIKKVENIDETTLKIELFEEEYLFEYNLIFPIVNSEDKNIGTGPYRIIMNDEEKILLEQNKLCKNYNNLKLKKINIKKFKDVNELYHAFNNEEIDIINTENANYEEYLGTIGYFVKEYKGREVDFLALNCEDSLLKDKNLRQAINCIIDKNEINIQIFQNNKYISNHIIDYGSYIYDDEFEKKLDLDNAVKCLNDLGWKKEKETWKKGTEKLSLKIIVNKDNIKRCEVAQLIKQQLEEFGILVQIYEVNDTQYQNYLKNKDFQILLTGVYNSYSPNLDYFLGKNNISNYKNEEVIDKLSDYTKYKEIANIVNSEYNYISLYRNKKNMIISKKINGEFTPNNFSIFYNIEKWGKYDKKD